MSGTVTSSTSAAAASTSSASSVAAQTGSAALNSLSGNFSDFLSLLMTQLQNQDPTSPLDSNQFTSELVQFSSVEQQINTNSDLTQLIQLTQASQVEQSSAMLGKQVTVNSTQLSNSSASVNFTTTTAEPIVITVTNASGAQVAQNSVTGTPAPTPGRGAARRPTVPPCPPVPIPCRSRRSGRMERQQRCRSR